MKKYKLNIEILSSFSSFITSDTLWGQICWAVRYLKGEEELKKFINAYSSNDVPPLLLSNAFPAGYLMRPYTSSISSAS